MPLPNLRNRKFAIMGIQGSGKTVLARFLASHFKTLVYTPHGHDWVKARKVHIVTPLSMKRHFVDGMEDVAKFFKKSKFDMLVVDEADMIFRTKFDIKPAMNDLVINHRHYNKALGLVTRRPQDIPPKILESCHVMFIYPLEGKNAIKHLEEVSAGLGKAVTDLEFERFNFIVKEIGKPPVKHEAVPLFSPIKKIPL